MSAGYLLQMLKYSSRSILYHSPVNPDALQFGHFRQTASVNQILNSGANPKVICISVSHCFYNLRYGAVRTFSWKSLSPVSL